MRRLAFAALVLALAGEAAAMAAGGMRTERVRFDRGTTGTTLRGHIDGYDAVRYVLGARRGQSTRMSLKANNESAYFNVDAPRTGTTLFDGSVSGGEWEGRLPADGDYVVTVYLMRNAARRHESANYRLRIDIAPGRGGTTTDPHGGY